MARTGAVFGGEHSGHFYFREFWNADSGMLAALHALAALGAHDGTLSSLLDPLRPVRAERRDQLHRRRRGRAGRGGAVRVRRPLARTSSTG